MNELSKFLVESILGEADSVKNVIVVYAGRFQPFHKGHYATYSHLVKKFGKNNVYIGTSDKTDNQKSPFNFKEKQLTMTKMFGIPSNRIVNVKNPYAPSEVLSKFDEATTAFVTVVGEKDSSRLGGKYFEKYKDGIDFEGYKDKGYVYIAPAQPNPISGTDVRIGLRKGSDEDKKNFFVKRAYGKYDDKIFNLIVGKLAKLPEITENHVWIPKHILEQWIVDNSDLIVEASVTTTIGGDVDDGPNFFFPNYNTFDFISKNRAEKIGYTLFNQIMSGELEDYYEHPIYPNGPVKAVTPFPAGLIGKLTATNQKDFNSDIAYPKWFKHVTRSAALVGYSVIDSIMTQRDKDEVYKFDKLAYTNTSNFVSENIDIPVKIGDTILTGKFKNKKTIVKAIGKDEHGMPTINGKKVVTFRMVKEGIEVVLTEIPMSDLVQIDKYADRQLNPVDVVITDKHFFDRLTDPRNDKPISAAELTGFFKRLAKNKKKFLDFVQQYGQIVAKDNRTNINIPFMQQANKIIAKTIMRKDNYMTSNPIYKFEDVIPGGLAQGLDLTDIANKHKVDIDDLMKEFAEGVKVEMEHTNNAKVAEEIALDHLFEDPKYYTKLSKIETNPIKEASDIGELGSGNNSTRWVAPNQSKKLNDAQLSGYKQTQFPTADSLDISKEQFGYEDVSKSIRYNNKVKAVRKSDGTLVFESNESNSNEYAMYRTHIQKPVDKGGLTDELNELTKGQLFRGTLKIGGIPVPIEVELLGADNKKKVFVTKVINIDKKYWNRIPSNGILEIPARIFRTPGGGWYKIKTPSVFETQYVSEVAKDDWHYEIIEKIYHKAGPFGKKKIAVVVTSNPNSSWEKIARELRVSDYEDVTEFVKKLGIRENLMFGYPDQEWMDNHEKELKRLRTKFNKEKGKDQYYEPALGGGITEGVVADGEPETGYIPDGKVRTLGYAGRPEPWFGQGGYTQLHFPKSDAMRGRGKSKDTESSFRKVTYKTSNVKVSTLKKALKPVGSDEWTEVPLNEGLLNEGGAYGHMNHPFDNEINLTFGQLKDIVNRALDGELELAREKTDGQALAISWVNGKLVAARNKGHLANRGANALDAKGVATKFSGRGELEKAYNFAMNDLSKAIGSLSEKQREKIFKNGACFMNLEVIYPTSVNVIPYGQPLLVFHGTMEYNEKGEAIGENQQAAKILAGMIKQVNQNVQSNYTIQGPPVTQLPKNKNLSSLKGKYNSQISKLQSEFKLSDNDGIGEYHQAWWTDFVQKKSPVNVDNTTLMGLVKRWAFYDKGFRLDSKNIKDEKVLVWAQKVDKEDHAKIAKNNIRPFEDIFLGVGAEVLSFMSSVLTANPDAAVRNMKQRLDQTIKDVQTGGDPKKIAKLKLELERLNAIGGKDKIVPNEGIVFVYGGKTFKLTGTFAPLNQILGLFYE